MKDNWCATNADCRLADLLTCKFPNLHTSKLGYKLSCIEFVCAHWIFQCILSPSTEATLTTSLNLLQILFYCSWLHSLGCCSLASSIMKWYNPLWMHVLVTKFMSKLTVSGNFEIQNNFSMATTWVTFLDKFSSFFLPTLNSDISITNRNIEKAWQC